MRRRTGGGWSFTRFVMRYRYYLCDVFTDNRFGGNQLAVLPDARGLSDEQMLRIAGEFNFSESTFVFPSEGPATRLVRIFTPTTEVPFAGHPNIGTAFTLATAGEFGEIGSTATVYFQEWVGMVPISILKHQGKPLVCGLASPESLTLGEMAPVEAVAAAVSLEAEDLVLDTHPPQVASVGLPFLFAELKDRDALARAAANLEGIRALEELGVVPDVHLYVRSGDDFDIRARVFAPQQGVPEDPATGSANLALAGLLAHYDAAETGGFQWRIAQGVEMGRPSVLHAEADKKGGKVLATRISGACVMVAEGYIEVG